MTPGSQHSIVNKTLMMKSAPQPALSTTDNGGMKIARKYKSMFPPDDGISSLLVRTCFPRMYRKLGAVVCLTVWSFPHKNNTKLSDHFEFSVGVEVGTCDRIGVELTTDTFPTVSSSHIYILMSRIHRTSDLEIRPSNLVMTWKTLRLAWKAWHFNR